MMKKKNDLHFKRKGQGMAKGNISSTVLSEAKEKEQNIDGWTEKNSGLILQKEEMRITTWLQCYWSLGENKGRRWQERYGCLQKNKGLIQFKKTEIKQVEKTKTRQSQSVLGEVKEVKNWRNSRIWRKNPWVCDLFLAMHKIQISYSLSFMLKN